MTRQKSDAPMVPEGRRKAVQTRGDKRPEGGIGSTVSKVPLQLELDLGTAEQPAAKTTGANASMDGDRSPPVLREARKPRFKEERAADPTMEEVAAKLESAFEKVASNEGAPGPDRQSIEDVREHLPETLRALEADLLAGSYSPGNIRRVWIPKSGGGERGLGIPNVIDRVVQEAVRQALEPVYEPTFHASSHGFRPKRSCHTAIEEARSYVEQGYEWVVDLDLEKFFDKVNHQRLMARLAQRVSDRRVLVLIGQMLKANVVMPDGVVVGTEEGVPQGGPLSPLLSNVVLSELDAELSQRGLRFVRYADDCNIYVASQRAGERVKESVTRFIERRMRLKVNEAKSAVARPEERHFLGFRLQRDLLSGEVDVLLSKRSIERLDSAIRERTPRTWGNSLRACIRGLDRFLLGWIGHFGICTPLVERCLLNADAHIRRRLRAIQLRHWKSRSTIAERLTQLGASKRAAWHGTYDGRKSTWALSRTSAVHRGLRNAYFAERGLESLAALWRRSHENIAGQHRQRQLRFG